MPSRALVRSLDGTRVADRRRRATTRHAPRQSPERDFGERSPDDHYILYTGGTTGMPKGVMWRQEDVFIALGEGIDAVTGAQGRVRHRAGREGRRAEAVPIVSFMLPPLMHGAAPVGHARHDVPGQHDRAHRRSSTPTRCGDASSARGVNAIMITGDAMGRPLIEALDDGPDRYDPSLAARGELERGALLADGEGPVPRPLPEPGHHRRDRLVRERLQRHPHGRRRATRR